MASLHGVILWFSDLSDNLGVKFCFQLQYLWPQLHINTSQVREREYVEILNDMNLPFDTNLISSRCTLPMRQRILIG